MPANERKGYAVIETVTGKVVQDNLTLDAATKIVGNRPDLAVAMMPAKLRETLKGAGVMFLPEPKPAPKRSTTSGGGSGEKATIKQNPDGSWNVVYKGKHVVKEESYQNAANIEYAINTGAQGTSEADEIAREILSGNPGKKEKFVAVFKQHGKRVTDAGEYKTYEEAAKAARLLNEGLQDKAIREGFRYDVEERHSGGGGRGGNPATLHERATDLAAEWLAAMSQDSRWEEQGWERLHGTYDVYVPGKVPVINLYEEARYAIEHAPPQEPPAEYVGYFFERYPSSGGSDGNPAPRSPELADRGRTERVRWEFVMGYIKDQAAAIIGETEKALRIGFYDPAYVTEKIGRIERSVRATPARRP